MNDILEIVSTSNPAAHPAISEAGEYYWVGHAGQGIEDAHPMRLEHKQQLQHLIADSKLTETETRYIYAIGKSLTFYEIAE